MKNEESPGIKDKFHNFLRGLDAFGQPVKLYFRGKTALKSSAGGIITLIIFFIMILLLAYSLFALVHRYNITIQQKTEYEINPPLLSLNKDNFFFSIGIQDPNITLNNSIFSYTLQQTTIIKNSTTSSSKTSTYINLVPCASTTFANIKNDFVDMSKTLCPENFTFTLQGAFGGSIFEYLKLTVKKCDNTNPNIQCATDDFINEYFQKTNKVQVVIYFVNRVVNPFDLEDPFTDFIDSQMWIISPLGKLARSTDVFFRSTEVSSFNDLTGVGTPVNYTTVSFAQDRTDNTYVPPANTDYYIDIFFRSSNYKSSYYRSYGTILQVLSFLGGIWNLLYLSLGFLAVQLNNHVYQVQMANVMYDFDARDMTDTKDQKKKEEEKNEVELTKLDPNDANNNSQLKNVIKSRFEKLTELRAQLTYSLIELFRNMLFCCRPKILKNKNKLMEEAEKRIAKDMDIRWIMKKIQDIEKLKNVTLLPHQVGVFNFVPPPIISTNSSDEQKESNEHDVLGRSKTKVLEEMEEDRKILRKDTKMDEQLKDLCQDLKQYYKHCHMYSELKKNSDHVSENLILSLHPEIIGIFECIEKDVEGPKAVGKKHKSDHDKKDGYLASPQAQNGSQPNKRNLSPFSTPLNSNSDPEKALIKPTLNGNSTGNSKSPLEIDTAQKYYPHDDNLYHDLNTNHDRENHNPKHQNSHNDDIHSSGNRNDNGHYSNHDKPPDDYQDQDQFILDLVDNDNL